MKKNQVNAILVNQTRRRNTVFGLVCLIIVIFVLSLSSLFIHNDMNKEQYVSYDESSNIDYKVLLKENDFFESNYLEKNNQYIANLIEKISAKFNYNLSLEEKEVEYKYSYRMEASVDVIQKDSNNSLYNKKEELLNRNEVTTTKREVNINEEIEIDYNYYNDLIKKFVTVYDLENVKSTLTINMYINVIGTCEDFADNEEKESVMSLTIPLTTKTIAIDISNNLINTENNLMKCEVNEDSFVFLFTSIVLALIDLVLIIYTIRYEIKTRTAENIYERELKKILNNYGSYIQTLGSEFDFNDYQLLKLDTFTDMLEIRDTIRQPILMKENKEKNGAYFVIPSSSKILYVYRLKVSDIEKGLKK